MPARTEINYVRSRYGIASYGESVKDAAKSSYAAVTTTEPQNRTGVKAWFEWLNWKIKNASFSPASWAILSFATGSIVTPLVTTAVGKGVEKAKSYAKDYAKKKLGV